MRGPRVALAGAAAAQLPVNPARFVPLGSHDVQAPGIRHARPQLDIRAAPGHIRRNGHGAALTGAGDDFRLLLVKLGVEHRVDDPLPL